MTPTRPSYVPSYVPHHCEVQHALTHGLCGDTPVVAGYVPTNRVEAASMDLSRPRIKWHCEYHAGGRTIGTLEEIFGDEE